MQSLLRVFILWFCRTQPGMAPLSVLLCIVRLLESWMRGGVNDGQFHRKTVIVRMVSAIRPSSVTLRGAIKPSWAMKHF